MIRWLALAACLGACGAKGKDAAQDAPAAEALSDATPRGPIPARSRQLVVAIAESWESPAATLRRFARANPGEPWHPVGEAWKASLGRSGLGWGVGLHGRGRPERAAGAGPLKREGDGRAAAGVFRIGRAYGYAAGPPPGSGIEYTQSTATWRCIDDPSSSRYNDILDVRGVQRDWRSAERMRRDDHVYELVVDIEHNHPAAIAGQGSCIFFHVWRSPMAPTAGCTAMERAAMEDLITWLEPRSQPVYVLLPRDRYEALMQRWSLPPP